ncbi:MAG: TlpA family protein disulfide reductase [Sediminibacterium sp.]
MRYLYFCLIFCTINCTSKSDSKYYGDINIRLPKSGFKKLEGKYLYLIDVQSKTTLDSVLVNKPELQFTKIQRLNLNPLFLSIKHYDVYNGFKGLRPIGFCSEFSTPNHVYSLFYADETSTEILVFDTAKLEKSSFNGSKQNAPYFKDLVLNYPEASNPFDKKVHEHNKKIIKSYPDSYLILKQLYSYKQFFAPEEIKKLLSYFNPAVKQYDLYESLQNYLAENKLFDTKYPSFIKFENANGEKEKVRTNNQSVHLIVYWASWCLPCRKEIPELKKLLTKYSNTGLSITSISIDGNKQDWLAALAFEKMNWQQLLAIDSSRMQLNEHYAINAIPKSYLYNSRKQLIKRFTGFSSSLEETIKEEIKLNKL